MRRVDVSIPPPPDAPAAVATAGVVLISRAACAAAAAAPPLLLVLLALFVLWPGVAAFPAGAEGVEAWPPPAVDGVVVVGAALTSCCAAFLPSATRAKPARAAVRDA